jgi:hypothetical protein
MKNEEIKRAKETLAIDAWRPAMATPHGIGSQPPCESIVGFRRALIKLSATGAQINL